MYQVEFDSEAEKELAELDQSLAQRILKKLKWLAESFDLIKPEPLHHQLRGKFKLRVGDYRVIYTADIKTKRLRVHLIGHRDRIYKT